MWAIYLEFNRSKTTPYMKALRLRNFKPIPSMCVMCLATLTRDWNFKRLRLLNNLCIEPLAIWFRCLLCYEYLGSN